MCQSFSFNEGSAILLSYVDHFEGSVHKGSISIYFRFSFFYTIRQIWTSLTSPWHQFFFLISQHRKSYKPSKNGAIFASAYLLCTRRYYRSPVIDRTFNCSVHCWSFGHKSPMCQLCRKFNLTACTKVLSGTIAPLCTIIKKTMSNLAK